MSTVLPGRADCTVPYKADDAMPISKPTLEQFSAYHKAWTYFNERLFEGQLSNCLLNFSRHARAMGFFSPERWSKGEIKSHEISLNPDVLGRPVIETMGTLVHEMVHQWQQEFGTPPRRCYHDREWAAKMEDVGLIPSSTGQPGGRKSGQRMTHYIDPSGRFQQAFDAMPAEFLIPWRSQAASAASKSPRNSKTKYTCGRCGAALWGKDSLQVLCLDCDVPFEKN